MTSLDERDPQESDGVSSTRRGHRPPKIAVSSQVSTTFENEDQRPNPPENPSLAPVHSPFPMKPG